MKLSELVAYRNALQQLSTEDTVRSVELGLGSFLNLINSKTVQFDAHNQRLNGNYNLVKHHLDLFQVSVDDLKADLQRMIEANERPWFQESYRLYDQEMRNDTVEYILNRRPIPNDADMEIMHARLQNYADWRMPAMIIRPGLESFIGDLVSFDPLYIVDTDYNLLVPAMQQYPDDYQRRLRPYVIHEDHEKGILNTIPNDQFGVCLVYNFFEFKPFEVIKTYLEELHQKLRPGGVLVLTFNDCDNEKAVDLVERHFKCYTPGKMIKELAKSIGYELIFEWNNNVPSTWLELKKSGTLRSNRGGQTLAKITPLSTRRNPEQERADAKRLKREAKARKNQP